MWLQNASASHSSSPYGIEKEIRWTTAATTTSCQKCVETSRQLSDIELRLYCDCCLHPSLCVRSSNLISKHKIIYELRWIFHFVGSVARHIRWSSISRKCQRNYFHSFFLVERTSWRQRFVNQIHDIHNEKPLICQRKNKQFRALIIILWVVGYHCQRFECNQSFFSFPLDTFFNAFSCFMLFSDKRYNLTHPKKRSRTVSESESKEYVKTIILIGFRLKTSVRSMNDGSGNNIKTIIACSSSSFCDCILSVRGCAPLFLCPFLPVLVVSSALFCPSFVVDSF